jgi:hypothetical protein
MPVADPAETTKSCFLEKVLTSVVIVMVTAPRYLGLRRGAPSNYSFQGMQNDSDLCLMVS